MRRTLVTLIILAILATGGIWAYQNYYTPPEEPVVEREEFTVERGTLTVQVNATGTMLPETRTTLSFVNPGRVAEVRVEEGTTVRAGEVLALLETTDMEFAVAQAELALASAQAQILVLQRDTPDYDIQSAQAALDSAQAAYRKLLDGPTDEEIEVARGNLEQAQASLEAAQAAYDLVAYRPDVGLLPQSLELEQANIAYEIAQANHDLTLREPTQSELSSARSAIVQAEASLERLQEGVAYEDLLLAQIAVEQSQLSLDQARYNLDAAELVAPHDGTITSVGIQEGEMAGGQPAFILTDLSQFHVQVDLDEIDVGTVTTGQPVTITLDALPGETLTGEVERIAEDASLDSGLVTYNLRIKLHPTSAPLRAGMTANVDIVTERRENVLLVANRFVRIDRTTGRAYVDRWIGDEAIGTEIQIGMRDETYSQVLAGLDDGDTVVLIQVSSRERLRQTMQQGPPH